MASRTGETENGPTRTGGLDDPRFQRARSLGSFVRQERTRPGAIGGSRASWPRKEFGSPLRACGQSFAGMASNPLLVDPAQPGRSSCERRRGQCWPATSSPSTRSCSDAFTCCSSSRSTLEGSTSPASPPTQRGSGSSSRLATSPRILPSAPEQPSSSSGTEIRSSLPVSTRCSAPRASESSRHPFDLHERRIHRAICGHRPSRVHRSAPHLRAHSSRAGTRRVRRSLQRPSPTPLSRPAGAELLGGYASPNRRAQRDTATMQCGPRRPHSRVSTRCVTSSDEYSARTGGPE